MPDTDLGIYEMENQPLNSNQPLQKLPNATAVLVLGICSILLGCFLVGFICGIIGLAMAKYPMGLYRQNPQIYVNYGTLNAGRILSIIGVILGSVSVIWFIIASLYFGRSAFLFSDFFNDWLDF